MKIKTKNTVISNSFCHQRHRSVRRGHPPPDYTMAELKDWALSQPIFHELYDKWVASDCDKMEIPSFDRTDDYQGYSLDRLQIITWSENSKKGYSDMRNGINNKSSKPVVQMAMDGTFIAEHHSGRQVARVVGCAQAAVSNCCHGKIKSLYGFRFMLSIGIPIFNNKGATNEK